MIYKSSYSSDKGTIIPIILKYTKKGWVSGISLSSAQGSWKWDDELENFQDDLLIGPKGLVVWND